MAELRVDADSDQCRVPLLDLGQDLLVDRELIGADRAEVERVERDDEPATGEVGERDVVAVLVGEREVRSGGSGLDHASHRKAARLRASGGGRGRRRVCGSARGRCARGSASRRRRRPTSISRPRREWWSLLWVRRCSVSSLIRSVSSATWTSVDPVSAPSRPYLSTSSAFLSLVSDISLFQALFKRNGRVSLRGAPQGREKVAQTSRASSTSRCICSTSSSTPLKRFSPRSRFTKATRSGFP